MRILYLSQLVPYPADAGPKVRILHVLQYLAQAGHQVTLLAFRRPNDRAEHIATLEEYCDRILTVPMRRSQWRDAWNFSRSVITGRPFLIERDSVAEMHRTLRQHLAEQAFDAIHADQLWMAQYALAAQYLLASEKHHRHNGSPKIVLDQHNAVFMIPKRMADGTENAVKRALLTREYHNLARYEAETCRRFDHVVWVTEEDCRAVRDIDSTTVQSQTSADLVIPISIDPQAKEVIRRVDHPHRVTFLGGLHWPPNAQGILWFFDEVWPEVVRQFPGAIFTVIGKDPPAEIARRAKDDIQVEVTGYMADPTPYLKETAVFIVPLQAAGGMRVKIIDAWSWGLPVVSTAIGAEGVKYQNNGNLLIADNTVDFSHAVSRLLQKPQLARKLASAGRRTVEESYDWRNVYRAWDEIYPRNQ